MKTVNLSAGSCRDSRHGVLVDKLFPVWKISKIVLDNYLSFPRAFTFDVPQGYMSKAGREDSEMVWATFDIFT